MVVVKPHKLTRGLHISELPRELLCKILSLASGQREIHGKGSTYAKEGNCCHGLPKGRARYTYTLAICATCKVRNQCSEPVFATRDSCTDDDRTVRTRRPSEKRSNSGRSCAIWWSELTERYKRPLGGSGTVHSAISDAAPRDTTRRGAKSVTGVCWRPGGYTSYRTIPCAGGWTPVVGQSSRSGALMNSSALFVSRETSTWSRSITHRYKGAPCWFTTGPCGRHIVWFGYATMVATK